MDVAGLSTWQTVTLKAADAQIRLMDEGTLTTVDLKAFFTAEAILKKLTVRTRLAFNVTGIDTAELWDTILKVIQGLYLAQRCPVCSFVSFTRRDSGEFEDAPETDLFPCPVGLAFADDTSLATFAEYMKSHLLKILLGSTCVCRLLLSSMRLQAVNLRLLKSCISLTFFRRLGMRIKQCLSEKECPENLSAFRAG